MGIDIQRVDHVGIRVRQKEHALAFYERLGFAVVSATGFDQGHPAILRHASGVVLNLLGPADDAPAGNVLMDGDAKPAGITHVALRVASLEAAKAELARHEIPLTGAFAFGALRAVFVRDPDGNENGKSTPQKSSHPYRSRMT